MSSLGLYLDQLPRAGGVLVCSKEYKKEILYPILVSVARRYGQGGTALAFALQNPI